MRLFIISYLVSVSTYILLSVPAIIANPLELVPRVFFYLGLPTAILLSLVLVMGRYLLHGKPGDRDLGPGRASHFNGANGKVTREAA